MQGIVVALQHSSWKGQVATERFQEKVFSSALQLNGMLHPKSIVQQRTYGDYSCYLQKNFHIASTTACLKPISSGPTLAFHDTRCQGKMSIAAIEPGYSEMRWTRSVLRNSEHVFPQTVWTHLGVLTVIVKYRGYIEVRTRARTANSLLFTVHSCLSKSSTCNSTAQARETSACRDCALVVVPRAFSHLAVTCRGTREGNLVFWWFKVDFS